MGGVLSFYNDQTQAEESGKFFLKNRQFWLDTAGAMVVQLSNREYF
jgi:hypothetical protein